MQLQNVSNDSKPLRWQGRKHDVRLQITTTTNLRKVVLRDVMQSGLVDRLKRFEVTCDQLSKYSSILRI
jgi:hypothetical protein